VNLAQFQWQAALIAKLYSWLPQGLGALLPADLPLPAGYRPLFPLIVTDRVLWFKETSNIGMIATSDKADLIVICGTHDTLEWIEDCIGNPRSWSFADGTTANVETGFAQVYSEMSLWGPGTPFTGYMDVLFKGGRPVHLIGHSLGSAVAQLAGNDALCPRLSLFASPKAGDRFFNANLTKKATVDSGHVRNLKDVVPDLPPLPIYENTLPLCTFEMDYPEILDPKARLSACHSMEETYLPACYGPA
jgi:predicted lipase